MEVTVTTLAQLDLIQGESSADLDGLEKILRDNYTTRISENAPSILYEDSYCPPNPIVDSIVEEMKTAFQAVTGEKIKVEGYWGHIHEKHMSTNTHNHHPHYVSAVLYVAIPEGSGTIVFRPSLNRHDDTAYASHFPPKRGRFFIFPSYLDHYVTRNQSDEKRISISFNFSKDE